MNRFLFRCEEGHEQSAPYQLTRCVGCVDGKACVAELHEVSVKRKKQANGK